MLQLDFDLMRVKYPHKDQMWTIHVMHQESVKGVFKDGYECLACLLDCSYQTLQNRIRMLREHGFITIEKGRKGDKRKALIRINYNKIAKLPRIVFDSDCR